MPDFFFRSYEYTTRLLYKHIYNESEAIMKVANVNGLRTLFYDGSVIVNDELEREWNHHHESVNMMRLAVYENKPVRDYQKLA
jgi:hypothetical protein